MRKFKTKLKEEMINRCRDNLNVELLALSSFCDMRYSHLNFLDVLKEYEVTSLSKEMVVVTFQTELETIHDEEEELEISLEPKKKKIKSFLDDEDDDLDQGVSKSVKSQLECCT